MNKLKDLTVDTPISLSRISSENKLKLGKISGDTMLRLGGVDQGGTRVVENYDYNPLMNHPMIEGNELIGDKTYSELGLDDITPQEIDEIIFGG